MRPPILTEIDGPKVLPGFEVEHGQGVTGLLPSVVGDDGNVPGRRDGDLVGPLAGLETGDLLSLREVDVFHLHPAASIG